MRLLWVLVCSVSFAIWLAIVSGTKVPPGFAISASGLILFICILTVVAWALQHATQVAGHIANRMGWMWLSRAIWGRFSELRGSIALDGVQWQVWESEHLLHPWVWLEASGHRGRFVYDPHFDLRPHYNRNKKRLDAKAADEVTAKAGPNDR